MIPKYSHVHANKSQSFSDNIWNSCKELCLRAIDVEEIQKNPFDARILIELAVDLSKSLSTDDCGLRVQLDDICGLDFSQVSGII